MLIHNKRVLATAKDPSAKSRDETSVSLEECHFEHVILLHISGFLVVGFAQSLVTFDASV